MKQAQPFSIEVSQDILNDLSIRLNQIRWTDEPDPTGWSYGVNPAYLRELVTYWKTKYDWRKQEALLNGFPQYTVNVDGVSLHFIYVKGKGANAKPLILTHEWPDSFFRFYKVIPMLTDPASYGGSPEASFDVIIPSMPGHGFSSRTAVTSNRTAELFGRLMTEELGYSSYYASGDWAVTKAMALRNPEVVKGIYLTDTGYPTGTEDWSSMSSAEQEFGQNIQRWFYSEGAFNMIQSTKPQTLGYGLNDSPVGLAAWIIEKFYSWSDAHGDLSNSFTMDELLTNIMIYWVTQTINTSIRRYAEDTRAMYAQGMPVPDPRIEIPCGVGVFPADSATPRQWAERRVNVTRYTLMPKGGRFAALEVPELWVNEVRAFFWGE